MSVEIGAPANMLAAHPETAYFWGRVAGAPISTDIVRAPP